MQEGEPVSIARSAQFQRLYERHFRVVWSVAGQLGLQGAAREDAVQEVWLVAYRRLHTLDPDASARAWLCSIARKVVWRHRRSAQRQDRREHAWADEPRQPPRDASERYETATTVHDALSRLSEGQRQVLVLTTVHGFTAPEIAAVLELPVNTVYSRLRLARRRLSDFAVRREAVEAELEARERPPQGARARVLAAVLPMAPLPWVGVASTLKAFALGGVVGGLAVAAGVTWSDAAAPQAPVIAPAAAADPPPKRRSAPAVAPAPDVSFEGGPSPATEPATSPLPRKAGRRTRTRVEPEADRVEPDPIAQPRPEGPSMEDEARLLGDAQRALKAGDASKALRVLRQHALQFPRGRLADVRDGVVVRALCALGRRDEAARQARRLTRERPGSPVATAVGDVCASTTDGSEPPRR